MNNYNFRPEVANEVISSVAVDYVGIAVRVKFGDSRSNGSQDIWGTDFVSNERTSMTEAYHVSQKRLTGVSPKTVFHQVP